MNVNVNLMEKNVIQINGGINDKCRCEHKSVMYVKIITFGILQHVVVEMENISQVLWMIQQLRLTKL